VTAWEGDPLHKYVNKNTSNYHNNKNITLSAFTKTGQQTMLLNFTWFNYEYKPHRLLLAKRNDLSKSQDSWLNHS